VSPRHGAHRFGALARLPAAAGRAFALLRQPVGDEKKALLAARWEELPEELKTPWQVVGRQLVHCGYTMGAAYCSFGCTHCYLPANANRAPLPTLQEMKQQIDANRRLAGPDSPLQITGGDVVDAYWRAGKPDELIEIVRYANAAGVVPMLMTHGQVLLENPELLERLVAVGGLRKLAVHIDITQAGRPGFPIQGLARESDLHPLRQRFVDLIHSVRRATGLPLTAAHTVTVTERNLDSLGDILTWLIADRRRLDAFGMVSFQTEAAVGRTRMSSSPVTPEATWSAVCRAVGTELPRGNPWFGHPECSSLTTLLVLYPEGRALQLVTADDQGRAFWASLLRVFGGIGSRGNDRFEANLRRFALAARHPGIALDTVRYARHWMRKEGIGLGRLLRLLRRPPGVLNLVMHNFMSASDVAEPRTADVDQRLHACSFRGAVRRNGGWEAVPMCAMNAGEREQIYQLQVEPATPGVADATRLAR
jgi:hypothetical protein